MRKLLTGARTGLMLGVLAACATAIDPQPALDSWIGASEPQLVARWGAPQEAFEAGGTRTLIYASERNIVLPRAAPSHQGTMMGNSEITTPTSGAAPTVLRRFCRTIFALRGGVVAGASYRGDDCKAPAR